MRVPVPKGAWKHLPRSICAGCPADPSAACECICQARLCSATELSRPLRAPAGCGWAGGAGLAHPALLLQGLIGDFPMLGCCRLAPRRGGSRCGDSRRPHEAAWQKKRGLGSSLAQLCLQGVCCRGLIACMSAEANSPHGQAELGACSQVPLGSLTKPGFAPSWASDRNPGTSPRRAVLTLRTLG